MGLQAVQQHIAEDRGQAGRKGNSLVRFKQFTVLDNTCPEKFPQHRLVHWNIFNEPVVHSVIEESGNIGPDDQLGRILLIQLPEYVSVSVMSRAAFTGEKGFFIRCGFSYRVKRERIQYQHSLIPGGGDMQRQFLPPLRDLLISVR